MLHERWTHAGCWESQKPDSCDGKILNKTNGFTDILLYRKQDRNQAVQAVRKANIIEFIWSVWYWKWNNRRSGSMKIFRWINNSMEWWKKFGECIDDISNQNTFLKRQVRNVLNACGMGFGKYFTMDMFMILMFLFAMVGALSSNQKGIKQCLDPTTYMDAAPYLTDIYRAYNAISAARILNWI